MPTATTEIDRLRPIPLFQGLPDSTLQQVQSSSRTRSVHAGDFIYRQGDDAANIYLLVSGRVKLSQETPEGQQVIMRMVAPGEVLGVIGVLAETKFPVSAEAVEDCRLQYWDQVTIRSLMERFPRIALNAIKIMAQRVTEFQDRIRELSTERVERRIARALLRLARQAGKKTPEGILIDLQLSRQDLAEMTGTTLFTVSRTLSQWESKGLIKAGRERVTILFPHGLVTIAEDLPQKE